MNTDTAARMTALFAKTSTPTLIAAALRLEAQTEYAEGEQLTLAWTCDEIARRGGGLATEGTQSDAFDALLDQGLNYTEALLVTFPELVA